MFVNNSLTEEERGGAEGGVKEQQIRERTAQRMKSEKKEVESEKRLPKIDQDASEGEGEG